MRIGTQGSVAKLFQSLSTAPVDNLVQKPRRTPVKAAWLCGSGRLGHGALTSAKSFDFNDLGFGAIAASGGLTENRRTGPALVNKGACQALKNPEKIAGTQR